MTRIIRRAAITRIVNAEVTMPLLELPKRFAHLGDLGDVLPVVASNGVHVGMLPRVVLRALNAAIEAGEIEVSVTEPSIAPRRGVQQFGFCVLRSTDEESERTARHRRALAYRYGLANGVMLADCATY